MTHCDDEGCGAGQRRTRRRVGCGSGLARLQGRGRRDGELDSTERARQGAGKAPRRAAQRATIAEGGRRRRESLCEGEACGGLGAPYRVSRTARRGEGRAVKGGVAQYVARSSRAMVRRRRRHERRERRAPRREAGGKRWLGRRRCGRHAADGDERGRRAGRPARGTGDACGSATLPPY